MKRNNTEARDKPEYKGKQFHLPHRHMPITWSWLPRVFTMSTCMLEGYSAILHAERKVHWTRSRARHKKRHGILTESRYFHRWQCNQTLEPAAALGGREKRPSGKGVAHILEQEIEEQEEALVGEVRLIGLACQIRLHQR